MTAGRSRFSLPPCGGGSGWGVGRFGHGRALIADPHSRPLPTRGRGEAPSQTRWRSSVVVATLFALLCASLAAFAVNYPALTGRIVDQANVISADTRNAIEPKLVDLETKSGIQLVVATVSSLEGQEIEPYANELFRTWKLGEKAKNNGVLLLVAPNEHRVRFEVGYGLEGTLTDALSKVIIANAIAPRLKTGDFSGGVSRGVDDIITVLTTDASEWQQRPALRLDSEQTPEWVIWLLVAGAIGLTTLLFVSPGFRWFFFNVVLNILVDTLLHSGGSSSGSSGGGFSGGGGSSGGGGASGSW
jgi:uncharacterized protein